MQNKTSANESKLFASLQIVYPTRALSKSAALAIAFYFDRAVKLPTLKDYMLF